MMSLVRNVSKNTRKLDKKQMATKIHGFKQKEEDDTIVSTTAIIPTSSTRGDIINLYYR